MGRRWLLIVGAIICGVIHFTVGAVMAVYGHHVDGKRAISPSLRSSLIDGAGLAILKCQISGPPAKAVIALFVISLLEFVSYTFTVHQPAELQLT